MLMGAEVLLGGLASLGGSLASQHMASVSSAEAFNRQKELMRLQNQYAVENWNRENAYNTPKAQKERLRAAGLNPDLMYGNGASGLVAGSIDSPSAPSAPMTPTMDFSKSVGDAVMAAQGIAAAKKAKSETVAQDIENKYLEERIMADISQTKAYTSLTKEKQAEVTQNVAKMVGEMNVMHVQVENLQKEGKLTQKQIDTFERRANAEIDYLVSQSELTKFQKKILEENKNNILKLAENQAELARLSVELINKYGDAQAVVGMLSQVVSSITDVASMFLPKVKFGK